MIPDDPSQTTQPNARREVCVVLAADERDARVERCLSSIHLHAPPDAHLETVDATAAAVDGALATLARADVVLLSEPCLLSAGTLTRLREAAYADTNTASSSALIDAEGALALALDGGPLSTDLDELAATVTAQSLKLRPRLALIVGPCVYLRRDALDLIGGLDAELDLDPALEVDFAQRGLLVGLSHVAADDALVGRLPPRRATSGTVSGLVRERYPHLEPPTPAPDADPEPRPPEWVAVAASRALPRALEAARRPHERLGVTIDGRALGSSLTGTQRHVLELIRALAATGQLGLRILVGPDTSAAAAEQLRALPGTELLSVEQIDRDTPRSAIFHRAQQVFETEDLRIALRLGERLVLNQLDLIAYRNPSYHADATAWRRYRRVTRQALAAADRVVVFSRHTEDELLSDELIDAPRVRVVAPGLDHGASHDEHVPANRLEAPQELERALAERPFLLCLGTDFRHKNRVFALGLIDAMRRRHGWSGQLVFAGTHIPHGSSRALEQALLDGSRTLRDSVIELGAIDEGTKAWLMRRASAILYPSVYEGFGLVPLEAALSGVPCLFAPQSSLAEVLPTNAAAIVPWDVEQSADRVLLLLSDADARTRQLDALLQIAAPLTWDAAAAATVGVYREAIVAPVRESAVLSRDELKREREQRALVEAQDAMVAQLTDEREHARAMYEQLHGEVGFALGLIGPHGSLPEDTQRALLALSARPRVSGAIYGALARAFRGGRALARVGSRRRLN
ncbi:MAG TPA: glycosyltransferase, partial [Solirubrobacteraceae bacterium]